MTLLMPMTSLRPDHWSKSCQHTYIIELTVPWQDAIDEAYEHKKLCYSNLAAEAEDKSWKVKVCPVEVRGLCISMTRLLREKVVLGQAQRRAVKELPDTAERSSQWLWLKRKDVV